MEALLKTLDIHEAVFTMDALHSNGLVKTGKIHRLFVKIHKGISLGTNNGEDPLVST